MFCPQCGSVRPFDLDYFCASCGESLERTGPAGSRWAPEPAVKARLSPVDARIHLSPYIASKLNPFGGDVTDYVVPLRDPAITRATDGLPLPPIELWEGYAETPAEYVADGRRDTEKMLGALHDAGASAQTLTTVLDFGCAAGRMLRHYPRIPDKTELWGVDINAKHIAWCQQNLSPPIRFA